MTFMPGTSAGAALRVAVAALALSIGLAACGGDAKQNTGTGQTSGSIEAASVAHVMNFLGLHGQPPIGPLPAVTGSTGPQLPLDPYYLSSSAETEIFKAERAAEQTCIHRYLPGTRLGSFGILVVPIPPIEPLPSLPPDQAARYGYHDPAAMTLARQGNPVSGKVLAEADDISLGTVRSFGGLPVPQGGCRAVGIQAVQRGISSGQIPTGTGRPGTVAGAANLIDRYVLPEDSRVTEVNARWSACMTERGYHYPNPMAAMDDPRWVLGIYVTPLRVPITTAEIRTATADVACRSRVNLYAVYWAVAAAYQREWLASPENQAQARAQAQADQVMLGRAGRILSG